LRGVDAGLYFGVTTGVYLGVMTAVYLGVTAGVDTFEREKVFWLVCVSNIEAKFCSFNSPYPLRNLIVFFGEVSVTLMF
jgi:hypothetical protein